MLIEIVDQQAQQIRQYTEQISQQADLLAKLARRFTGIEEGIDDQKSDNTSEQQVIHVPRTT
jgi:prefoldin subunit 5